MADRPSDLALLWQQIRHQNRVFWRTPIAAFFTLVFPLMFLVLFNLLFGGEVDIAGEQISVAQFFAPTLAAFAAASATYTNIGVGTAIDRDNGILKRVAGSPLPRWIHLGGRIGSGVWIALIATTIMLTVGVLVYDVEIRSSTLLGALITFLIGAACFAALGVALAAVTPSGDAAPAVANATLLPIAFISDVFIPVEDGPTWLVTVGELFPLRHFALSLQDAFNPFVTDAAFRPASWAVMAAWAAIGAAVAWRFFSWEAREERAPRGDRAAA